MNSIKIIFCVMLVLMVNFIGFVITVYAVGQSFDNDDHGNDAETATLIKGNTSTIEGRIEVPGDIDYFVYDANIGEDILIHAESNPGGFSPFVSLLSTDGVTILRDSQWTIPFTFPENGRYFIRIQNKYAYSEGTSFIYTLILTEDDHSNDWENATPIGLNTPVDGMINLEYDQDYFSFNVKDGDTLSFEVKTECEALYRRLEIYDIDGITPIIEPWRHITTQPFMHTFTRSGTYFIEVSEGEDETLCTYNLTLTPYQDKHGNLPNMATFIPLNTSIESIIDIWGDVDYFSFDVNDGDELIITMSTENPSFIGKVNILDRDGVTNIRQFTTSDGRGNTILSFAEGGQYFVQVLDSEYNGGDNFLYKLDVALYKDDHGDTPETATLMAKNTSIKAALSNAGDSDWFSFDGESGESIVFKFLGRDKLNRSKLTLFGPDRVTRFMDVISDNARIFLPFTIPESGRYFVRASHESFLFRINLKFQNELANNNASAELRQEFENKGFPLSLNVNVSPDLGNQQINAWKIWDVDEKKTYIARMDSADTLNVYGYLLPQSYVSIPNDDPLFYTLSLTFYEDDHSNTYETATPIELNTSIDGAINTPGDVDCFSFNASNGDRVIIDATRNSTIFSPIWYLSDKSGSILKNSTYSHRPLIFTIPEDGQYFVLVRGYNYIDGSDNNYSYTMDFSLYTDDHGDNAENATLITKDTQVNGRIGLEIDTDWFAFDVNSGDHVIFTYKGYSIDRVTLFDTDGITQITNFRRTSFFTFPKDGRYYIQFQGYSNSYYSNIYEFTLYGDNHGNIPESATSIELDTPVNGAIKPEHDIDWFTFNAQSGDTLRIAAVGEDSDLRTKLTLFDTDGITELKSISIYDDYRGGMEFTIPENGQYFIQVMKDSFGNSGDNYFYVLELSLYKDDHGDDLEHATPVTFDSPVEGIIGVWGDVDWFSFDANKGDCIIISATDEGSSIKSILTLTDGIKIIKEDRGVDRDASIIFFPSVSGKYFINIQDYHAGYDDSFYTLKLTLHEDDHGDDPEHATPIEFNTPTSGVIVGDVDCFSFEAKSGDLINIEASSDNSTPRMYLIGTDGKTRISGDGILFSKIKDFSIPEDGTYYINFNVNTYKKRPISYTITAIKEIFPEDMAVDLSVSMAVDSLSPSEGDTIACNITVANSGPDDATGIEVTYQLPEGVTYLSNDTIESYNKETGIWIVGNLSSGTNAKLVITFTLNLGTGNTNITNTATVTKVEQTDPDEGNNTVSKAIPVLLRLHLLSASYDVMENILILVFNNPVDPAKTCLGGIGMEVEDSGKWDFNLSDAHGPYAETDPDNPRIVKVDIKRDHANTVNLAMALLVNKQKVDILLKQGAFTEIAGGLSRKVLGTDNIGIETISDIDVNNKPLLMQNYPNPFNPETWIPYQLSKPANVTIFIYNVDGKLVKQLKLGYMMPGYYIDRSRAAYWDGK
ncbi:DUF11 domain-containing protein, partial [Candidatus Poribacteria bacterium]|nr:DUF11 domain-containing protein [Candidatus Poribacteria bacterium]